VVRVSIDVSRCRGHQMCIMGVPDVFVDGGGEDGKAEVTSDTWPSERLGQLSRAVVSCPERAIRVDR
jgi:ferredoxin